ncbi:putative F-box/LRR-repeat protein At3g28410 isoform X2 [Salvia miltiorrhiza]|uniref:putative F-box/LRR-repeat protein At3g28410 isoform X2 n=1 Tax=Salvia miltiorrhiza TaxID=226208 RepID=UPI0025AB763F|nr:putative F-box/LRR-repeat protein At3g28410 isoform X2 [Salvia miltiorrhiza]
MEAFGESSFLKSKMLKANQKMVDKISKLPDDIIAHILSLFPTTEAAATSVVSHRWIELWKYTSKLTFKGGADHKFANKIGFVELNEKTINGLKLDMHERERNINRVNSALKSHKALSLKEFKINFFLSKAEQQVVREWVEFAFARGVEKLELNLGWHERLAQSAGVVLDVEMIKSVADFKSSLKVLCVRCIEASGDAIEMLLRHCKLLERLVLVRVRRRSDVEIIGPSLKHLDMRSRCVREYYFPEYAAEYNIKVCAPNLTWLTIDQNSKRVWLDYVPNLVNMNFYCRFPFGDTMHHFAKAAAQLQTLIIHLYKPLATFSPPQMPKLKKLVVYYRTASTRVSLPVTRFLCAAPNLEDFKLEISEAYMGSRPPGVFEVPKVGSRCPCGCFPHRHLKLFLLSGYFGVSKMSNLDYSNFEVSLDLVRYIVENCVVLEEIVIGHCDRVGLVKDIVDYDDESLSEIIVEPQLSYCGHVATPEQQQAFEKIMQMQHIPRHIKLRLVFEIEPPISLKH